MKNNTSRAAHALCIAAALVCASGLAYEKVDFSSRPLVAGNATIVERGYVVRRDAGTANFSPELRYPIELVYDSKHERKGLFGFAWRSPQLESSAAYDKDGMLWVSPWGEKFKFFPKDEKTPKDAIKLAPVEEAKKGVGFYSPYSEWEARCGGSDPMKSGIWTIAGKRGMKGWEFAYSDSKLAKITAPSGRSVEFSYDRDGRPVAVSQDGMAFVEIGYTEGGNIASVAVNGIRSEFSYESATLEIQPKTKDGSVRHPVCPRLVSMRRGSLAAETYSYRGNFLASAKCGRGEQTFTADASGRLISDSDFRYSYVGKDTIVLKNKANATATYRYDQRRGVFDMTDFSGRKSTIAYFMRYDVAYLGKAHTMTDGKGRRVATMDYDVKSGCLTRVRDMLGNDRSFEYDAEGRLAKRARRACGSDRIEPVAAYSYDKSGNLVSAATLDEKGGVYSKKTIAYSGDRRPTRIDDGQNAVSLSYNKFGYPKSVSDSLGNATSIEYDRYNTPIASRDRNGVETRYTRSDAGLVTRVEHRDVDGVFASIDIAYDEVGLPVSYTDQDGLCKAFDRDEFGRVVAERFPDGSTVGYQYDAVGRLATVTDENGHDIRFDWSRFGLSSRTTAAGQLTDYVRGADGLLSRIVSSQGGREDRAISRRYDEFDRLVALDYGNGETETFQYDEWSRIAKHTRGASAEEYWYDHFGRIIQKDEDGVSTQYKYDSHGNRTHRLTLDRNNEAISEEYSRYDSHGRLVEASGGAASSSAASVKYSYDAKGRLVRQKIGDCSVTFEYTRRGQLKSKTMLGANGNTIGSLAYNYSKSGRIESRRVNGELQKFHYDKKGQLVAVADENGGTLEKYDYDPAGNILAKTVNGETTRYEYDAANQLVSATDAKGAITHYAYDAAGRMVREGAKRYTYGYLDKVMSLVDGENKYAYTYHVDGQIASATYTMGGSQSLATVTEDFLWDGLALVKRGKRGYINEPHVGGGNPVLASNGTAFFNDMLGTTLVATRGDKAERSSLTAFGDDAGEAASAAVDSPFPVPHSPFYFTGKPDIPGLGRAFLMRNYRADLGKWQTADPLGYPDGWNQLAYCKGTPVEGVDFLGGEIVILREVYWCGYHISTVSAECNHSFTSPSFTIQTDRLVDDPDNDISEDSADPYYEYCDKVVKDGATYEFYSISLVLQNVAITRPDLRNVRVNWEYQVKIGIEKKWTVTTEDGTSVSMTQRFVDNQAIVSGVHNIAE